MDKPGKRLEAIRKRLGLEPFDVASSSGISLAAYNDLEWHNDLNDCIALADLKRLCSALNARMSDLFSEAGSPQEHITFEEIKRKVQDHLTTHHLELSIFEDNIGWELTEFMENPEAAWRWNINGLRDLCSALGIDWLSALPQ